MSRYEPVDSSVVFLVVEDAGTVAETKTRETSTFIPTLSPNASLPPSHSPLRVQNGGGRGVCSRGVVVGGLPVPAALARLLVVVEGAVRVVVQDVPLALGGDGGHRAVHVVQRRRRRGRVLFRVQDAADQTFYIAFRLLSPKNKVCRCRIRGKLRWIRTLGRSGSVCVEL